MPLCRWDCYPSFRGKPFSLFQKLRISRGGLEELQYLFTDTLPIASATLLPVQQHTSKLFPLLHQYSQSLFVYCLSLCLSPLACTLTVWGFLSGIWLLITTRWQDLFEKRPQVVRLKTADKNRRIRKSYVSVQTKRILWSFNSTFYSQITVLGNKVRGKWMEWFYWYHPYLPIMETQKYFACADITN